MILCSPPFRPLALGLDALLPLEFPGPLSARQGLWNPIPRTVPVPGRPKALVLPGPGEVPPKQQHACFLTSILPKPIRWPCENASVPDRHSLAGLTKARAQGWGEGELLCYMERLSPLSENKAPPSGVPTPELRWCGSAGRAGARGGQVALFGITDIAPRCSGTLSK